MSRRPGYSKEYYWANRERELAYRKELRAKNPEHFRQRDAAWRKENSEKVRAAQKKYRQKPENRAKEAAAKRAKRAANPEMARVADRAHYAKAVLRKRKQCRVYRAKVRLKQGRDYLPRFNMRLPEWAEVRKRVLDANSAWLECNATPEQRAYAKELATERNKNGSK